MLSALWHILFCPGLIMTNCDRRSQLSCDALCCVCLHGRQMHFSVTQIKWQSPEGRPKQRFIGWLVHTLQCMIPLFKTQGLKTFRPSVCQCEDGKCLKKWKSQHYHNFDLWWSQGDSQEDLLQFTPGLELQFSFPLGIITHPCEIPSRPLFTKIERSLPVVEVWLILPKNGLFSFTDTFHHSSYIMQY